MPYHSAVDHPYRDQWLAVATMHGKERAIAPVFSQWYAMAVSTAPGIDTDALGTFTGEIPRAGSMLDAARAKARLAIDKTGAALGLASEGTFGPDPSLPFVASGLELLVLREAASGHEIVVQRRTPTNYEHIIVAPSDNIDAFLLRVGFPKHGLVVKTDNPNATIIAKGIIDQRILNTALARAFAVGEKALITTDMRAHLNPTRMASIERLARRLALRAARLCPACGKPGFGVVDVERGLPCNDCESPTRLILAEIYGCSVCGHRLRRKVRAPSLKSDAMWCELCNP